MPRYKKYDYSQSILLPVEFDKQILPGTIEYVIDYMVEKRLNLKDLESKYKNDETGAPAYDPKIMLKILLLAYTRGIISSRKIERLCNENIIFKALSADSKPDFTTIAWFVRSMERNIRGLFCDILLVCKEMDLIGGTIFAVDGCKISSNASKEWSGRFSDLEKKKTKLKAVLKNVMATHKQTDIHESRNRKEKKAQCDRIKRKIDKIDSFLKTNNPKAKTRHGERQSNITDNESAKMQTSHGMIQGYNGMAIVDNKHQVICAAHATGSGQEQKLFAPLITETKENMKKIKLGSGYLRGKKVIADTGLFSEDNATFLSKERIDGYIPDQYYRKRDPRFKTKDEHKPKKERLFTKDEFLFQSNRDIFICPNGKILKYYLGQTFGNTKGRVYKALLSDCKRCLLRKKCLRSETTRQRTLYVVEKYFDRNYSEEMKRKIDSSIGRRIYSLRMGIIEPVFGNIRASKGLDRFSLRTESKVNIQWLLFGMIHNIEKVKRYGRSLSFI
jgi:transposase